VFSVAALEVTHLGEAATADLEQVYAQHLSETVRVRSDAGVCSAAAPVVLPAAAGFVRVELGFVCENAAVAEIEVGSFFSAAPSHIHMADVRVGDGTRNDLLFTQSMPTKRVAVGASAGSLLAAGPASSFGEYVAIGFEHILAGSDHLAFVAVLLLLCSGYREVAFAVTGFTLGHSVSLAAAVFGWLEPSSVAVEALIGYTIAIAALECSVVGRGTALRAAATAALAGAAAAALAGAAGNFAVVAACSGCALFAACYLLRRGDAKAAAASHALITMVFGIVHGFGFASPLVEMHLPAGRIVAALLGFNLGVEAGQLLVVAALLLAAGAAKAVFGRNAQTYAYTMLSSALGAVGVFWLVSRSAG